MHATHSSGPERFPKRLSLFLGFLLLAAFALTWRNYLDTQFPFDYDEGVYLLSARMLMAGYSQYTSVFSSQPPAFLEILALAFRLFGDTVAVGRGVMIFFSLVSLVAIGWISWRLAGPLASPVAILSLGLSMIFFRQSFTVQPEMPSLAFALLAVAIILPTTKPLPPSRIAAGGILFALGMACKLLIPFMVLPLLFLLTLTPHSKDGRWQLVKSQAFSTLAVRFLLFGLPSLATLVVAVAPYDFSSAYDQVISYHDAIRKYYSVGVQGPNQPWSDYLRALLVILVQELGLTLLAASGLIVLFLRNRLAAIWVCLWVLATGLFLVIHYPVWHHQRILFLPPFAVAASASVLLASTAWQKIWGKILFVLFLTLPLVCYAPSQGGLTLSAQRDLATVSQEFSDDSPDNAFLPKREQEVIDLIYRYTQPKDVVVSDQPMQIFVAGRQSPLELNDTSGTRIESGYLTDDQAIDASKDARMVILWRDRLGRLLPQYRTWVQSHFQLVKKENVRNEDTEWAQEIYLRKTSSLRSYDV